jgi:sugar phosphate isomerase/epimerase
MRHGADVRLLCARSGMKLGFLTGELAAIEKAARLGFSCVELECSALGDPRTGPLDPSLIDHANQAADEHGVEIVALAYYGAVRPSAGGRDRADV